MTLFNDITEPKTPAPRTRKPKNQASGHSDHFQTPAWVLQPLLPYLRPEWWIWEPACGKGNLAIALAECGHEVIASDLIRPADVRVYVPGRTVSWWWGKDFLTWKPAPRSGNIMCDGIITNPPFSLKDEFIARCYELGLPFALLLPFTALEGQVRQSLYRRHGLEIIFLPRRVNFETPNGKGSSSWFPVCWFTHGLHIGQQLTFSEVGS
jgi:hypothetical protein